MSSDDESVFQEDMSSEFEEARTPYPSQMQRTSLTSTRDFPVPLQSSPAISSLLEQHTLRKVEREAAKVAGFETVCIEVDGQRRSRAKLTWKQRSWRGRGREKRAECFSPPLPPAHDTVTIDQLNGVVNETTASSSSVGAEQGEAADKGDRRLPPVLILVASR
ncbi:hypothetical protein BKA81DRAFT_382854 [Phyllosticta paracitricarpa]